MKWFAVHTTPRWEKKVSASLLHAGIDHYCPLHKVSRQWSDRKKTIEEPLFKGYVFVRLDPEKKWEVRSVPGILNFVHWLGKPAVIKDDEILTIRKFLSEFTNARVVNADLEKNDEVRITQGVLMNYKGIVLEKRANQVMVKIDSMGLQLIATFTPSHLMKF